MSGFGVFEEMAEEFFEGKLGRLLGSRLQPVHIANLLSRAVEDEQTVSADGHAAAPNRFLVEVNQEDFRVLEPMLPDLQDRLADYITRFAGSRGIAVIGCVRLSIQPAADVPVSRARVVSVTEKTPTSDFFNQTHPIQTLRPQPNSPLD